MLTDIFKKKINIKFILPNFHNMVFLNLCFITLQEHNKDVFKKNYKISGVQGCFPYSIWSLERNTGYITCHDMETTLKIYSEHKINVYYVFENNSISKYDLNDYFSNLMLKLAHKEGNGVFVKSRLLYNYIKEKYPLYKVIKIAYPDEFNENDIAVMDKYNNKFKKNDIKYKKNTYVTLNPICPPECKNYNYHRKYIEQEQLGFYSVSDIYLCPLKPDFNFYDLTNHSNFVSDIKINDYINAGFRNFRINFPSFKKSIDINYDLYDTIDSYIYYLIKPEYKNEIRHLILKKFAREKNG